ncbi:MAG: sigma-54 interaction domain-containing protein [Bryobacteraceae bacterium]
MVKGRPNQSTLLGTNDATPPVGVPRRGAASPWVLLVMAGRSHADHYKSRLAGHGFHVDLCRSVPALGQRTEPKDFDAIILDWKTLQVEYLGADWHEGWRLIANTAACGVAGVRLAPALIVLADNDAAVPPEIRQDGAVIISYQAQTDGLAELIRQAAEIRRAQHPGDERERVEELLIGRSAAIRGVMEQVHLVAPKDTSVLITGETGTGKERVSRAIHLLSRRQRQPMVSVNCGGIPPTLLEDEFFGHVKGAFTDARSARVGRFEQAHGSTVFLDEIGDLPLELQPKLLRVLQEREIHRIGGVEAIRLDVRVIAATNVNLWRRVAEGRFREDLYYRINVFPIHLPPLRERCEDIPLFIRHFLDRLCRRDGLGQKRLAPAAENALASRPWRGNIRELENAVEIAVIRSGERSDLTLEDFPAPREAALATPGLKATEHAVDLKGLVARYERDLILRTLDQAQGNKNKAAQMLGLKRTTLIEKLKRLEPGG